MDSRSHGGFGLDGGFIPRAGRSMTDLLRAASSDPARPLDTQVRGPLEQRLNYGQISVHGGGASEAAAASAFDEFYQNPGSSKAPK